MGSGMGRPLPVNKRINTDGREIGVRNSFRATKNLLVKAVSRAMSWGLANSATIRDGMRV